MPKEAALYTGDSLVDAQAAKAAGIAFAGVTTGTTAADELARFPHVKIVSRLADLLPKA